MTDNHRKGVALEVWGPLACFTRPEFGVERYSYPVITPSAAVGLISSIYWHPGVEWRCNEIRICNPVRYYTTYTNEVSSRISAASIRAAARGTGNLTSPGKTQQRYTTLLRQVKYQLFFEFDIDASKLPEGSPKTAADIEQLEAKVINITARRLEKGACYHQPCFGSRQYYADFRPLTEEDEYICPDELVGEKDFGVILHSVDYDAPSPAASYYRCIARNGIIKVPDKSSEEVCKL